MDFSQINIGSKSTDFFRNCAQNSWEGLNRLLKEKTGIVDFFEKEEDFLRLKRTLKESCCLVAEDRIEYGDFQTNRQLAQSICNIITNKGVKPQVLIEPTCGKGSFILSAVQTFGTLQHVCGIEIKEHYLWILKFELLDYFMDNPTRNKPDIRLYHHNIFDFDFSSIKSVINDKRILIIGNPPWVTNSTLSTLNSKNLPEKSNFKQDKGIEAITGKGNFDIGEFIALKMLELFAMEDGCFAFLVKTSVIKNIIYEQKRNNFPISNIEKYNIDAQKEFGAAVDAGLFVCKLKSTPVFTANEYDFYTSSKRSTWGWVNENFTSDTEKYKKYQELDDVCPFEWRQGIKHDCTKVMELERTDRGGFRNALGEEFELEEDLIYGILKSSDLKGERVNRSRKYVIVTQKKTGQDTENILEKLPKTKEYLCRHKEYFQMRKSSIYKGKPLFSIFGIGDYSFAPFKVAISGLYKQTRFTLVEPNKTVLMLDDTCYFIGFNDISDALITQRLLNRFEMQDFMKSFVFFDTKRVITKEVLMRIGLRQMIRKTHYTDVQDCCSLSQWESYQYYLKNQSTIQRSLFPELR
jgi:hypothetical protein